MFKDTDKTYRSIVPRTWGMDEKAAFEAWMETGSLPRAAKRMEALGYYNKRLNKPFSGFAVRHAACRYIAANHEDAKPVLLKAWRDAGVTISDEDWEKFVVDTAAEYLASSKERFMRWLEANAWALKYDYMYARKFGLEQKHYPKV
jgi:hypothetical protein